MLYSIVGILVIILDQAVKFWVSDTLFGTDVVRFIPGVISLVNVHNDGAAFSFLSGSDARIYFIIATGVFTLLVVLALATNFIRGKFSRWCLVFVAAGGLGNMIDRIIYGYVQDMFKVELFNFAIFNVADVFITVFAILFAFSMIFEKPESDLNDVLYENDVEDEREKAKEKTSRKGLLGKKKAVNNAQDEYSSEAGSSEKKNTVRSARQSRQEKYEQEYEQYKAQQLAAMKRNAASATTESQTRSSAAQHNAFESVSARPAENAQSSADPFDAWVQANARAEAREADSYAGRLMDAPKTVSKTPSATRVETPKAVTASAPKPAPKPVKDEDEFNLDDILAEFK